MLVQTKEVSAIPRHNCPSSSSQVDEGREIWEYLENDEDVKKRPQTNVERHHLGLPVVGFSFHPSVLNLIL